MQTLLVTGSTGFVGRALVRSLHQQTYEVREAVRTKLASKSKSKSFIVGSIDSATDWKASLNSVDVVIHLASRVHVMKEFSANPWLAYKETNVLGTERLARMAAENGVRRFIFMSSIKVNGEATFGQPFTESDPPRPQDTYAHSKLDAEKILMEINKETGMEVIILRPPLVYGPQVKGNFLTLLRAVDRRKPLPFASVKNLRSLIYVENLVDVIVKCISTPEVGTKTYLVADNEKVSTPELINLVAQALGRRPNLIRIPLVYLKLLAGIAHKKDQLQRLTGSLEIDNTKVKRELSWEPPYSMEVGLKETTRWFQGLTVQS